jgi:hypothetical protein
MLTCSTSMLLASVAKLLAGSGTPWLLSEYMWCSFPVCDRRIEALPMLRAVPLPLLCGRLLPAPPKLLTSCPGFGAAGIERLPRLLKVSLSDSWMFLKGCAAVLPILAISL